LSRRKSLSTAIRRNFLRGRENEGKSGRDWRLKNKA
jgi:hypothetical protein